MVEITRRLPQTIIKIEGNSHKECFDKLASYEEIFGESECGVCGCDKLTFCRRTVEGNNFYEMACLNKQCRARLAFGASKTDQGSLFPKRRLINDHGPEHGKPDMKKGEFTATNGWTKWRGKPAADE